MVDDAHEHSVVVAGMSDPTLNRIRDRVWEIAVKHRGSTISLGLGATMWYMRYRFPDADDLTKFLSEIERVPGLVINPGPYAPKKAPFETMPPFDPTEVH